MATIPLATLDLARGGLEMARIALEAVGAGDTSGTAEQLETAQRRWILPGVRALAESDDLERALRGCRGNRQALHGSGLRALAERLEETTGVPAPRTLASREAGVTQLYLAAARHELARIAELAVRTSIALMLLRSGASSHWAFAHALASAPTAARERVRDGVLPWLGPALALRATCALADAATAQEPGIDALRCAEQQARVRLLVGALGDTSAHDEPPLSWPLVEDFVGGGTQLLDALRAAIACPHCGATDLRPMTGYVICRACARSHAPRHAVG